MHSGFHGGLAETRVAHVLFHPRQGTPGLAWKIVRAPRIGDGLMAAGGGVDVLKAGEAVPGDILEAPGGFVDGWQDKAFAQATDNVHLELGLEGTARMQRELEQVGGAHQAEQLRAIGIADTAQQWLGAEGHVVERDAMALGRKHFHRQRDITLAHLKNLHQPGFMFDAVAFVPQVMEMKGVDFLFWNFYAIGTWIDPEGFTGVRGEYPFVGVELRQLQVPPIAETAVGGIERVESQLQGNYRATEIIGLEFG